MSFQPGEVQGNARRKFHADGITAAALSHVRNLVTTVDQPFGKEKPDSQFAVVSRGSHRDRNATMDALPLDIERDSDFQRLFDREDIDLLAAMGAGNAADWHNGNNTVARFTVLHSAVLAHRNRSAKQIRTLPWKRYDFDT